MCVRFFKKTQISFKNDETMRRTNHCRNLRKLCSSTTSSVSLVSLDASSAILIVLFFWFLHVVPYLWNLFVDENVMASVLPCVFSLSLYTHTLTHTYIQVRSTTFHISKGSVCTKCGHRYETVCDVGIVDTYDTFRTWTLVHVFIVSSTHKWRENM
jgi:hypothetical protein